MLFVLIVAIPFYVMVMTSLKNQQSLLLNPLDFSIDPTVGRMCCSVPTSSCSPNMTF